MRGLSSLVAAVLVIAMTLLIAMIVSSYVREATVTESSQVRAKISELVNCSLAGLEIQSVFLDTSQNNTRVVVRNVGQQRETVISADIFNRTGGKGSVLTPTLPASLAKGDVVNIVFNVSGTNNPTTHNSSLPNVTCASFSQVIVSSECITTKFDRTPNNC